MGNVRRVFKGLVVLSHEKKGRAIIPTDKLPRRLKKQMKTAFSKETGVPIGEVSYKATKGYAVNKADLDRLMNLKK